MVKYSRTSKYEDLRNRLQNDAEVDVNSKDLNDFEQRLHRINSANFAKPEEQVPAEERDPLHARRQQFIAEEAVKPVEQVNVEPEVPTNDPRINFLHGNENYTSTFNNEYLDEYIKEVKQYNMDHGNSSTMSTDLNILRSLKNNNDEVVRKPYPNEASPKYQRSDTADIPFFGNHNEDLRRDFVMEDDNRPPLSDTRTMTKEDIAAEVQNLIRGAAFDTNTLNTPIATNNVEANVEKANTTNQYTYQQSYDADRTARQQLLNETTQIRAQLDDYEENLTEVSDKMRHTNQILNIVLIVLIVALVVVLAVVIYWVLSSRGIL